MAKVEVILTHNIVGLGAESDQVKVAAGYARNYLLPQHLAIPLTGANKRRMEVLKQRRAEREANELNSMSELGRSLSKITVVLAVKTGDDGKMFGSVTSGTIADELKKQLDVALDKKKIHLEAPIRALGEYEVELRLHADVKSSLKVRVESTTPVAKVEAAPAAPEAKDGQRGREVRSGARAESKAEVKPEAKPERKGRPVKPAAKE